MPDFRRTTKGEYAPALDVTARGRMLRGVVVSQATIGPADAAATKAAPRRRRPPSLAEQRRRREWGRKWGQAISDGTKQLRERGS